MPKLEKAFSDRNIYSGFYRMTRNIASVAEFIESEVKALRKKAIRKEPEFFIKRNIISFDRAALLEAPDFLTRELITREASALSGKIVSIDHVQSLLLESYMSYKSHRSYKSFP